jgi:hypothetical protein
MAETPMAEERVKALRAFVGSEISGVPWYQRTDRRAARERAQERTAELLRVRSTAQTVASQLAQLEEDRRWDGLLTHDPGVVIDAVDQAFADNASESTCIDAGVQEGTERFYVTVVVLFGTAEMIPDRKPALTPRGNPTLHKRSKTERNALHLRALASTVLATAKEAFAVALSADDVNVVVLQDSGDSRRPRPIYLGQFARRHFDQLDWATVDPVSVLLETAESQIVFKGVAKAITPLHGLDSIEQIAESFVRTPSMD